MPQLNPDQFGGRASSSTDYSTGRQMHLYDVDPPDRRPDEPHGIRAKAQQVGSKSWTVAVHHGPFDEKDESGSFYKTVDSHSFEGTNATARSHVRRLAAGSLNDMVKRRGS